MKFRVGDKVRVIHDEVFGDGHRYVGLVRPIARIGEGCRYPYFIKFPEYDDECGYNDAELELVDVPAASTDDNDEIIALLRSRLVKGRETYGVGVSVEDGHDWVVETLDEVLDGLVYTAARLIELRRNREKRGDAK